MSKELTLESVKHAGALSLQNGETRYAENIRLDARRAWWAHCEAVQSTVPSIPSFREFWNDEATYELVK